LLRRAHTLGAVGRFQLEAAIQSVHCARATSGVTNWDALLALYDALVRLAPTLGARVSRAAVLARISGPAVGLAALDELGEPAFQPWWAVRGHLLAEAGLVDDAARAYAKAISLTTDPTVLAHLHRELAIPRT
jgi:RNA polymerase sigma-70 factor (ECF subfamily)